MYLASLSLQDFRNYSCESLEFHNQVTRVVGNNAQGKTNLLEALYYLGRGYSFRTSQKTDLIRHGCPAAFIRAEGYRGDLKEEYAIEIGGRRRFLRNGKAVRQPDRFWPHAILFAPEEALLFKVGPSMRRDYLNRMIAGMDSDYRRLLRQYEKILLQRNRLLKQVSDLGRSLVLSQLSAWNRHLVESGLLVMEARRLWVERLFVHLELYHSRFASEDGGISLKYEPHVVDRATFEEQLSQRQDEELARGMTVVGPQRDELSVFIGEADLRHFGSQGQHRSVVLALKLAEVSLARQVHGESPLLLLDDVTSELDSGRVSSFFEILEDFGCQIVLTTTHIDQGVQLTLDSRAVNLHVNAGQVLMVP